MMISKFFSLNVLLSTLISTALYFVIANICYYYINSESMFKVMHYFRWVEYVYGTVAMLICTLIIEGIRSVLRKDPEVKND